jgi:hypothetical protein
MNILTFEQVWSTSGLAKPRTILWVDDDQLRGVGDRMVGYVHDRDTPADAKTGYDAWITHRSFVGWIRRTGAKQVTP